MHLVPLTNPYRSNMLNITLFWYVFLFHLVQSANTKFLLISVNEDTSSLKQIEQIHL